MNVRSLTAVRMMAVMLMGLGVCGAQADDVSVGLLKKAGAVQYAQKVPYGAGIAEMLLGYDAEGKSIAAVASRETATYQKTMTYVTVVREGDGFKIQSMDAPDVAAFHGKSRDYAEGAMKDVSGKTLADAASARGLVDAVSGATPQLKAIYVSASLMASKMIDELNANPSWERKPLP